MTRLKVTQAKSKIGGTHSQRESLRSLGLKRIGDIVIREDRPEFRGMIKTVRHWSPSRRLTDMADAKTGGTDKGGAKTGGTASEGADQRPASNRAGLKLHHLRPAPARAPTGSGWAAARPRRARRPGAAPRAPRRAARSRPGSKAARCRCTAGSRSCGASPTPCSGPPTRWSTPAAGRAVPRGRRRHPGGPGPPGRGARGRAGQGAGRGRRLAGSAGDRARLLRLRREKIEAAGGTATKL